MNDAIETAKAKPGSPSEIALCISERWRPRCPGHGGTNLWSVGTAVVSTYVHGYCREMNASAGDKWRDHPASVEPAHPALSRQTSADKLLEERGRRRGPIARLKARFLSVPFEFSRPTRDPSQVLLTVDDWKLRS